MRSYFKLFLLSVLLVVFCVACKQTMVPVAGAYPSTSQDRLLVMGFEDYFMSSSNPAVNPFLYNLVTPVGGLALNGTGASKMPAYGAPVGIRGAHMEGELVDLADGVFPSHQLRLSLKSGSTYYNMSFFSGIKFYLQLPSHVADPYYTPALGYTHDKLINWFNVYLRETTPLSDGGDCNNADGGCYNHFAVNLDYTCTYPCGYGTGWVQKSFTWDQFTREAWGDPVYPTTLSGDNLLEVIMFEWQSKLNNVAGKARTDISIDDVRFF